MLNADNIGIIGKTGSFPGFPEGKSFAKGVLHVRQILDSIHFLRHFRQPKKKSNTKTAFGPLRLLTLEDRITPSTFTVINTNYSGPGSLGEAITLANTSAGNDEISFSLTGSGPFTITLESALPIIVNANAPITGGTVGTLTIIGLGASSLTISGDNGNSDRDFNVFNIDSGGVLTISGVTVSGGKIAGRGGAFNNFGTLNISNSTLTGNTVTVSGGVYNYDGTVNIVNTIIANSTGGDFYGVAPTINLSNLVEDGSITGGGSISGDPLLGPL